MIKRKEKIYNIRNFEKKIKNIKQPSQELNEVLNNLEFGRL